MIERAGEIPTVDDEATKSFFEILNKSPVQLFHYFNDMQRENPVVVDGVHLFTLKCPEKGVDDLQYVAKVVYSLLEHQLVQSIMKKSN
jgi:hypothetical protein